MRTQKFCGILSTSIGIILITLCGLGQTDLGRYPSAPVSPTKTFNQSLANSTASIDDLLAVAKLQFPDGFKSAPRADVMKVLYNLVATRFTHGNAAHYNIYSNWLAWVFGFVPHSPTRGIHLSSALLKHGDAAQCGQVSYVLVELAEKAGIKARQVGLYGHVVMEAWYDNDWHLYDADKGWYASDASGNILSTQYLSFHPEVIEKTLQHRKGFTPELITAVSSLVGNRSMTNYQSYPEGSWFCWHVQAVYEFEKLLAWLMWLLPAALILVGLTLLVATRRVSDGR